MPLSAISSSTASALNQFWQKLPTYPSLWAVVKEKFFVLQAQTIPCAFQSKVITQPTSKVATYSSNQPLVSLAQVSFYKGNIRYIAAEEIEFTFFCHGNTRPIFFENRDSFYTYLHQEKIFSLELQDESRLKPTYLHFDELSETFENFDSKEEFYLTLGKENGGAFKIVDLSAMRSLFVLTYSGYFHIGFKEFDLEQAFLQSYKKKLDSHSFALKCLGLLAAGSAGIAFYKTQAWSVSTPPSFFKSALATPSNLHTSSLTRLTENLLPLQHDSQSLPASDLMLEKSSSFLRKSSIKARVESLQRRLLSTDSLSKTLPNQLAYVSTYFEYSLNSLFEENYTLLSAAAQNGEELPTWLTLKYASLGNIQGSFVDLALNANQLVAIGANGLQIYNVSNPSQVRLSGQLDGFDAPKGVVVNGNTAYVADNSMGLQIIDTTDATQPAPLASFANAQDGSALGVALTGSTAFVADWKGGLQIIDVSDCKQPFLLSNFRAGNDAANGVAISGNTAFIADWNSGLHIVNISDRRNPQLMSTFPSQLGYALGITISDTTAFVANGPAGLQILDISDLPHPQLLSTIAPGLGNTNKVLVRGNTAYIAEESAGLHIYDITNRFKPSFLGRVSSEQENPTLGLAVSQNLLFIANGPAGLEVVSTNQGKLSGTPRPSDAFQSIRMAVTARDQNKQQNSATFNLLIDQPPLTILNSLGGQSSFPNTTLSLLLNYPSLFTHPSSTFLSPSLRLTNGLPLPPWLKISIHPSLISTIKPSLGGSSLGVTVSDHVAFVAEGLAGVKIVDLSDLNHPRVLSTVLNTLDYSANQVVVSGNISFVADGAAGVRILDIHDLKSPRILSTLSPPRGGTANGIALADTLACVAYGEAGIQLLDVSNPNSPRIVSSLSQALKGSANAVALSSETLFVADGINGLQMIDIHQPTAPQILTSISVEPGGSTSGIYIRDETAFAINGLKGIALFDIQNISAPIPVGSFLNKPGGSANDIATIGNTVFIADGPAGLQIGTTSNRTSPQWLGSYPASQGGSANGISIMGNTALIAEGDTGLKILDLTEWQIEVLHPTDSDAGNYPLQVVATDPLGGQAHSNPFILRIEGPPRFKGTIPQQYAKVGQFFSYFIPQGLCTDPNFDPISFKATLDGGQLPLWLKFNGVSALFAGVPGEGDVGNFNILLQATDNIAGTSTTSFRVDVAHLPSLATPIPQPPNLRVGRAFSFTVPSQTFRDMDSPLTYQAKLTNGSTLPPWINFNSVSRTFSGTPHSQDVGALSLETVAIDCYNQSTFAPLTFLINSNSPPVVVQPISDQSATVGEAFKFSVASNTFKPFEGDGLYYNTSHGNGDPLPKWLKFDPMTMTFEGTPGLYDTDSFNIRIVPISLYAFNTPFVEGSYSTASFNIHVGGTSFAQLFLKIISPIFSGLTLSLAAYKKRALLLNQLKSRRLRYFKGGVTAVAGANFVLPFDSSVTQEHVILVGKIKTQNCFLRYLAPAYPELPGGALMPSWLEYHYQSNRIRSRGIVPKDAEDELVIQVQDKDQVIIEQFNLQVISQEEQLDQYYVNVRSKEPQEMEMVSIGASSFSPVSPDGASIDLHARLIGRD